MAINLDTADQSKIVTKAKFSQKEQFFEVAVFLFLIVPSLVLSFFAVQQGTMSFVLVAISTILRDLALVSLILFFSLAQRRVRQGSWLDLQARLERGCPGDRLVYSAHLWRGLA